VHDSAWPTQRVREECLAQASGRRAATVGTVASCSLFAELALRFKNGIHVVEKSGREVRLVHSPLLPKRWSHRAGPVHAQRQARSGGNTGISAHLFGSLATHVGPMALRPRLATGLPLSKMVRPLRPRCGPGKGNLPAARIPTVWT